MRYPQGTDWFPGFPVRTLQTGPDGRVRCSWALSAADSIAYHDQEWGRPVADDRLLLEALCLDGFQSGLSWLVILRKREAFRAAFAGFDPERVARFDEADVARLLEDAHIVRHRGKIEAAIANARAACRVKAREGSLAHFLWAFEPPAAERPAKCDAAHLSPLQATPASRRLAKALKAEGFRWVGPTTAYAFMQAVGMVNDHLEGCVVREEVEAARAAFRRP